MAEELQAFDPNVRDAKGNIMKDANGFTMYDYGDGKGLTDYAGSRTFMSGSNPASSGQQADTAAAWLDCAQARLSELQAPTAATHVLQDLRRWLPSSWPIGAELVGAMLGLCVQHLGKGVADVRTLPQLVQGVQEPRA